MDAVDSTAVVVLDNARHRNALTLDMRYLITEAVERASADRNCRAIVLTGAGGHFCGGGDLSAKFESGRFNRERMHGANDVIRAIAASPKPVLAAVDGAAYGYGFSLAMVCDLVVAGPTARFCASFAGVGLAADGGLHHTLPRRAGLARARRMIFTGEVVDARLGAEWGLVDVPAEAEARPAALALAQRLQRRAPLSLAAAKAILSRPDQSLDEVLERELTIQVGLLDSEDFQEGREAFLNKRPPAFRGQ
ncbi:MAG: enoyl-CoA hydratase/isomerase family protein [Actinomycetota bacterium]|nr:enoyl-CoA hydratase/isomerase family protein [Actinomycetota bacterium]